MWGFAFAQRVYGGARQNRDMRCFSGRIRQSGKGRLRTVLARNSGFAHLRKLHYGWPKTIVLRARVLFNKSCRSSSARKTAWGAMKPSGNSAFDAYKMDTLKRLEDEQHAFESFLERLREAKDKSEFDAFMDERAEAAKSTSDSTKDA